MTPAIIPKLPARLSRRAARLRISGRSHARRLRSSAFGARNETESVHTSQHPVPPTTFTPIDAAQTTHSGFAQHKLTLLERFDLSYGGRIHAGTRTAPSRHGLHRRYRFEETGTKLRGSAGTGARVASLYQRFSQYGDPALAPETSIGLTSASINPCSLVLWSRRCRSSRIAFAISSSSAARRAAARPGFRLLLQCRPRARKASNSRARR